MPYLAHPDHDADVAAGIVDRLGEFQRPGRDDLARANGNRGFARRPSMTLGTCRTVRGPGRDPHCARPLGLGHPKEWIVHQHNIGVGEDLWIGEPG